MKKTLPRMEQQNKVKKCAFTLAEVLITLGVIGIVAAMTLPSLIKKQEKLILVNKLKKTYTVLNQQFMRAQLDNGDYDTWAKGEKIVVETYFNTYFKPYFNNATICKNARACGYKTIYPWKNINGSQLVWALVSDSTRVCFMLNDGTFIFLPRNTTGSAGQPVYVNYMYVDINGFKNPNIVGHDVFIFQLVDKKGLIPYCSDKSENDINADCTKNSSGNVNCCTAKIISDGWEIKDDYPW